VIQTDSVKPAVHSRQRRHPRHLVPRVKHRPKPAPRFHVITFQPTASPHASGPARKGTLLLLGAVAMLVLALASASMLRLLRRTGGAAL
jgi:hypothetical protein